MYDFDLWGSEGQTERRTRRQSDGSAFCSALGSDGVGKERKWGKKDKGDKAHPQRSQPLDDE